MSLNEFTAQFQGGARPSLFRVTQTFPGIAGVTSSRKLSYMCKGAQLPGSTVEAIPVMYMGREVKVAGDRTFEDMTLTIINDTDFEVRNAFERWMTMLNTHATNLGVSNPALYWADMSIEQLGREGDVLKEYKLIGCFPNTISPIDLDFASTNTVEEYTVNLSYQYWVDLKNGIT